MNNMDLISRSALLGGYDVRKVTEYDESGCGLDYKAVSVEAIEAAPAVDAVEVVRCRDCVHGKVCKFSAKEPDVVICVQANMFPLRTSPDFYCAHGKKNGGEVKE